MLSSEQLNTCILILTIIVSIGGWIFQYFFQSKRSKEEIKMNAIINWIQAVRNQTAELLTNYNSYNSAFKERKGLRKTQNDYQKKYEELSTKIKSLEIEYIHSASLLALYFSDKNNEGTNYDEIILSNTKSNKNKHAEIQKLLEKTRVQLDQKEDDIRKLTKYISIYLKVEWDKTKNGNFK